MRLGKTTLIHFISQVVVSLAGFLATFAIARVLGAEGVGVYALGIAVVTWLVVPMNGLRQGLTKRISEGEEKHAYFTAGVAMHVLAGVLVVGGIYLFADQVNRYIGSQVSTLIAAIFVVHNGFVMVGGVLEGEKKVAEYGWVRAFERIARTGLQVGLILAGYGVAGLFFGHAVSLGLALGVGFFLIGLRFSIPEWRHVRSLFDFAQYSWLGGLKDRTFGWMDTIVLGFFVTSSLIGIYEVAWTLASFFVLVANSIRSTLFPELSELSSDNQHDRIHHFIDESLAFTGIFLIPGFFGAMALGTDVLRIYSPEFTDGALVLLLLISARTFDAYGTQLISAINALDKPDIAFRINGLFVILNVSLNVILIMTFGWYGAAVATLLSGIVTLLLSYYALTKLIGAPSIPFREIGRQVLAAIVMLSAVIATDQVVPQNHYTTVLLAFIGVGIYLLILLGLSTRIREKAIGLANAI